MNIIEKISINVLELLFDDNYIEDSEDIDLIKNESSEKSSKNEEEIGNNEIVEVENEKKNV